MEFEEKKEQELDEQMKAENLEEAQQEAPKEECSKKEKRKKCDRRNESDAKIQEMGEKLAEVNDKYLRTVAEYENYRKRTAREKQQLIINGGKDVVKSILPVVDDLERALQSMPEDDAHREGVQLIYNKLMNTLSQQGLKLIEAKGEKFDENLHEAVTQIPAPDESLKGCVVDVVEKGYYLNDMVLRYPKVVVAI